MASIVGRACGFAFVIAACSKPPSAPVTAPSAAAGDWSYEVDASPGGATLAIGATFSPGSHAVLGIVSGAEAYVRSFEAYEGGRRLAVVRAGATWPLGSCASGCSIRYTFALQEAASAFDDRARAFVAGNSIQAPPSTFLVRPIEAPSGTRVKLHVTTAPGDAFVSGLPRGEARDTYAFGAGDSFALPYAAVGRLSVHELGGDLTLAELGPQVIDEAALLAWATDDAKAFRDFYGAMPTSRVLVLAQPTDGDGVGFGSTTGSQGAAIIVSIGRNSTRDELHGDWTLVHELVHTALPNLADAHHWLEEGLATYVESLVRVRAGLATPEGVWRGFVRGMPYGRPEPGDRGLDRTPTWGRTFWGGALFCFVADLEIRERTNNQRALDDALRAIVAAGGTIKSDWPIERVLDAGDAGTGVTVLRELYERWANAPVDVDLDAIWKRLGVVSRGDQITFDDRAPIAATRIAMTARRPPRM